MGLMRKDLIVGQFYWVLPANDPDEDMGPLQAEQPALFVGWLGDQEQWVCLGVERVSDWPMKWVGPAIEPPRR